MDLPNIIPLISILSKSYYCIYSINSCYFYYSYSIAFAFSFSSNSYTKLSKFKCSNPFY